MTDERVAFYLQHRMRIEEWAALRSEAAASVEAALRAASQSMLSAPGRGFVSNHDGNWRWVGLTAAGRRDVPTDTVVAVGWNAGQLFKPGGSDRPYLGIRVGGLAAGDEWFDTVKSETRTVAAEHAMTSTGRGWPWWGWLPMTETDVDSYAAACIAQLLAAWEGLSPVIASARVPRLR